MTLNDYIEACAEKLGELAPERHVYTEELPSNADGNFFIRLADASQETKLGDWRRRAVSMEILYFLAKRENASYNDWADGMLMSFETLKTADRTDKNGNTVYKLHRVKNAKAYRDDDGRVYHFIFDIEHDFYIADGESEVMEVLEGIEHRRGETS